MGNLHVLVFPPLPKSAWHGAGQTVMGIVFPFPVARMIKKIEAFQHPGQPVFHSR